MQNGLQENLIHDLWPSRVNHQLMKPGRKSIKRDVSEMKVKCPPTRVVRRRLARTCVQGWVWFPGPGGKIWVMWPAPREHGQDGEEQNPGHLAGGKGWVNACESLAATSSKQILYMPGFSCIPQKTDIFYLHLIDNRLTKEPWCSRQHCSNMEELGRGGLDWVVRNIHNLD